jgi:hypothetical protein
MTVEEMCEKLKDVKSWQEASSRQRGSFGLEMNGRQYGQGPLIQAWLWFASGWNAAITQPQT